MSGSEGKRRKEEGSGGVCWWGFRNVGCQYVGLAHSLLVWQSDQVRNERLVMWSLPYARDGRPADIARLDLEMLGTQ